MIAVSAIDWQPMSALPKDRKDGRLMLLWNDEPWTGSRAFVCKWNDIDRSWWEASYSDEPLLLDRPAYWADINPPA